ncbi:MAG: amidohydrolase, partial [Anaerolineae bacterium]|nr:amidohydrolase [Anaerolineae bacterium]
MGASFGLTHAIVLTMDDQMTVCEAVFVEEGKIKACGTNQEITALCRERKVEALDLQGHTVLPGFHDCHLHMMNTGRNYSGIDMYDCASVDDVLDKVREAAATYSQDHWIYGKRLDESRLREKRPPTAAELDQVAPGHPVYLSDRGLHYTLVNTAGFELLGLSPELPGVRKSPDGGFNGRLHEKANSLAKRAFLDKQSYAQREEAFRAVAKRATEVGITTLHTVEGGELFSDSDIPVIMDVTPQLPVDVLLYWCTEDINKIKEAGLPRQGGDFLLDGSIGSRTAAFKQPYADAPDTHGFLYYSDDRVEELVMAAHLANVQISFHVIGELAITQALDAFERVLSKYPKVDHRHRLEHFGFPLPGEIERAARLGIAIVTQPAFMYLRGGPGSVYNERLGDERASGAYPLRKFLDAGLLVGGGSDSDVTPMDPLFGIHAAVNQPYPESSISVIEA